MHERRDGARWVCAADLTAASVVWPHSKLRPLFGLPLLPVGGPPRFRPPPLCSRPPWPPHRGQPVLSFGLRSLPGRRALARRGFRWRELASKRILGLCSHRRRELAWRRRRRRSMPSRPEPRRLVAGRWRRKTKWPCGKRRRRRDQSHRRELVCCRLVPPMSCSPISGIGFAPASPCWPGGWTRPGERTNADGRRVYGRFRLPMPRACAPSLLLLRLLRGRCRQPLPSRFVHRAVRLGAS